MTDLAITKENIRLHARALKLPTIARQLEDVGRRAREAGWAPEEYLLELLDGEVRQRGDNVARQRIAEAHFPLHRTIEQFDFALGGLDRDRVLQLARCEWVRARQPVVLAGPVGTGKTHLAIALGIEAAHRRFRVRFHRAADLVRMLAEAKSQHELGRMMKRLVALDVLVVDELGFVPFDRTGAELLFNALADRHLRRSTLVTTNLAFSEWVTVLGDEKMTAALLDRLSENAHVLTTSGSSYRARHRRTPDE